MFAKRTRNYSAIVVIAVCHLLSVAGCAQLSLPAIDPSGERLFLPCPNATTLTLPCIDDIRTGDGCFSSCLPKPAFVDPPTPPRCLQDNGLPQQPAAVPAPVCVDECATGPKAVYYDGKCDLKSCLHLPNRGKRGRILLNHQKVIAPVGGEVMLLSGICGKEGYLEMGEPIEWMLTPDSVGHFIEVGDDRESALHRLVSRNKVEKLSGSFARGRTSTKAALVTRGNLRRDDDVSLRKGETWLTVSSPSEGISRVTVMAPESDCWDQRKATATIYWVDAEWQFPPMMTRRAGEQAQLITRVMRKEGGLPATNWKVLYRVMNPEVALFQGADGNATATFEATVNSNGEALALLRPVNPEAGTAIVQVSIIRPPGLDEALPQMTLGTGQTLITWSAPRLEITAGATPFVARDDAFPIAINVRNSGDLSAEGVKVAAKLPAGMEFVSSSLVQGDGTRLPTQPRILGENVIWDIGNMPAQQQLDIELVVKARASFDMSISVRGADGSKELFAEDRVRVNVAQRNLSVLVTPVSQRVQVGKEVSFEVEVTNNGDQPIQNVSMEVRGDDGLIAFVGDSSQWQHEVFSDLEVPLMPGVPWKRTATFQVRQAGQRCVSVKIRGAGAQRADASSCVIGEPAPPANPAVSARMVTARNQVRVGELVLIKYYVRNDGGVPLTNVRVLSSFDETLQPRRFTQGHDDSQLSLSKVAWIIPQLNPGEERLVEGEYTVQNRPGFARVDLTIGTDQNVSASSDLSLQVLPNQVPDRPAPVNPNPVTPAPIPNNPTQPIPGPSTPIPPAPVNPPINNGPGALRVSINTNDNPVAVGEEITFDLAVKNDRNVPDAQVAIEVLVPAGTRLQRVTQTLYQGNVVESISQDGTVIRLNPIPEMRAGEEVRYTLVLISSLPQIFTVEANASSRGARAAQQPPATDTDRTEVIAQ